MTFWTDRPVFVTGATGLLGSHLVHELVGRGADVVCLVRDAVEPEKIARLVETLDENYGYRLGLIGAPSRICQALAPLGFGLLIEPLGTGIVLVSSLFSLSALVALMLLPTLSTHSAPKTGVAPTEELKGL